MPYRHGGIAAFWAALALVLAFSARPAAAAPFAYVVNQGDGTVSVIDTGATPPAVVGTPISVGPLGNKPLGVAVTPDGTQVYVVNNVSPGIVSVIATATNMVTPVQVGNFPVGVAITSNGTRAYVTNAGDGTVSVIDTATNTLVGTPIGVGKTTPLGIAVTPDGKQVYVANNINPGTVSVIATATNTVTTVPVGAFPAGVAISPNGTSAYVTNQVDDTVSVIDTASNTVGTPINVGSRPTGIAVTPDGKQVYVANASSNTVSVIATATNMAGPPIGVGTFPQGVAVTPDGKHVYVANSGASNASGNVSVIDTGTNMVATVAVGNKPTWVAIGPAPAGVPFALFSAKLAIQFGKTPCQDFFEIAASFTLGTGSKGINPVAEEVKLKIGKFAIAIPPGSFKAEGFGTFAFEGVLGGVSVQTLIFPTGTQRYELLAAAQKADLTGTRNPVPVALSIGDDSGMTSVKAIIFGGLAAVR